MTDIREIVLDLKLGSSSTKTVTTMTGTLNGLKVVAEDIDAAINRAFTPDANALQSMTDWVGLLAAVIANATLEVQNLIALLTAQHEETMWSDFQSQGIDFLALMVQMYSAYQTLLAMTGALTVAGTAQSAAWTILNTVETVATTVTTALGAAIKFLTSPIGLVVAAIGALIAIVVLLVKNWDSVKAAAVSVWEAIKGAFSSAWEWFKSKVLDPISNGFKGMINGVIGFLNSLIGGIVKGINGVIGLLNKIRIDVPDAVPIIGGLSFGFNIPTMTAPQIPQLARGAVLPANKPFLALVGDQRHGTNVEAPLATIQQAVSLVMQQQSQRLEQRLLQSVQVQNQILEAVLGIEIGDSVIGEAYERYRRKMAIAKGGV